MRLDDLELEASKGLQVWHTHLTFETGSIEQSETHIAFGARNIRCGCRSLAVCSFVQYADFWTRWLLNLPKSRVTFACHIVRC